MSTMKRAKTKKAGRAKKAGRVKKAAVSRVKARKPAAKKVARKVKASAKSKTIAKKRATKVAKIKEPYTKSQILDYVADNSDKTRKEISEIFDITETLMRSHLKGCGKFVFMGMKITVKDVPAKKERKGINPFTGEPTIFKAKPRSKKVKIIALKKVKEMA